jgi:hypothetical protein
VVVPVNPMPSGISTGRAAAAAAALGGETPARELVIAFLLALPLVLLVQWGMVRGGQTPVAEGVLFGPDAHMRVERVERLIASGRWYDPVSPRSNAPDGEVLHWTRPLDVLLILAALPARAFTDWRGALFQAAVWLPPLLHVVTLAVLVWAAAPVAGRALWTVGLLMVTQGNTNAPFIAGNSDHHSLQILLLALSIGCLVRLMQVPERRTPAIGGGIVAGITLWISFEGMVPLAVSYAALGVWWLWRGEGVAANRRFALAVLATITAALAIERPPGDWLAAEYDRLSLVQWVPVALVACFWLGARGEGLRARLIYVAAGGVVWLIAVRLLDPVLFAGPLAGIDPRIRPIWFDAVSETQPMWKSEGPPIASFILCLGGVVFAAPALWFVRRRLPGSCLYLGLLLAVYTALSLYQVRFVAYEAILLPVPLALALALWFVGRGMLARVAGILVVTLGIVPLAAAVGRLEGGFARAGLDDTCTGWKLARFLETPPWNERRRIILNPIYWGPELIYHSRHQVIATPYHRNGAGIAESHAAMAATDPAVARAWVERRGVALVTLCKSGISPTWDSIADPGSLYRRLHAGDPPAWLAPVALPADLSADYLLFAVRR